MIAVAITLAVLLEPASATPVNAATCELADNLCKARRYERKASSASTPEDKAYYLLAAHRSYLFSFDESGDPALLCSARKAYDASLEVEGQSAAQRASTEAVHGDLAARERRLGAPCAQKQVHKRKHRPVRAPDPQLVAVEVTSTSQTQLDDGIPPPGAPPPVPKSQLPQGTASLANATPRAARVVAQDPLVSVIHAGPPEAALLPVTSRHMPIRPGRGLVIAGSVTLGAGLALAGAASYIGGRMIATHREARALGDAVHGFASDEQLARDDMLTRDYERMGQQTLALALTGGATVVVAAILLGVGGRRMALAASRTAVIPAPGGLVFRARF